MSSGPAMTPAVAVINCVDPGSLKQLQQEGGDPVSLMYEMMRENKELYRETAHTSGTELKKLYSRRSAMTLDDHGVMRIQIVDKKGTKTSCGSCIH